MFVFAYYDPDSDAVTRFRDWERAWRAGGWTPRILTRRMAFKHSLAKHAPADMLPWFALLATIRTACLLCDSLDCRPGNALGVHEVPDKAAVEVRC